VKKGDPENVSTWLRPGGPSPKRVKQLRTCAAFVANLRRKNGGPKKWTNLAVATGTLRRYEGWRHQSQIEIR
jgi:hypothetical protein